MELAPEVQFDLEDGTRLEIRTHPERIAPGVVGCEVRTPDGATMLALLEDCDGADGEEGARVLRALREREPGHRGADLIARVSRRQEAFVSYRDAAVRRTEGARRCALFASEDTTLLFRVLSPRVRAPWPWPVVARLGLELARAMERRLVTTIDPYAVGIDAAGAWILDPSLDLLMRPTEAGPGILRGTPPWLGYTPPEVLRRTNGVGTAPEDAGARHGLGVLLYELLVGAPLYTRETPLETIVALRRGLPPSISRGVPGVPLELAACVHALLDQDPLRRPESALVASTLSPFAASDLAWAEPLRQTHARPYGFLRRLLRLAR